MKMSQNPLDVGFDPTLDYGHYPVEQTKRDLTPDEAVTVAAVEAKLAAEPNAWWAKSSRKALDDLRGVVAGDRVSRMWIVTDPVAELVRRAAAGPGVR
jgi:hypothetical protein